MAGLKKLTTRIINKHATAAVWNSTNFTPLQGEIIVYDPGYDSKDGRTYDRERMKIGDGSHNIQDLPFSNELEAVVTKTSETVDVVTKVGTPTYTSAQYTAPSMSHLLENDILTVKFDAGHYVPATFTAGEQYTSSRLTYVTDVNVDLETPYFKN